MNSTKVLSTPLSEVLLIVVILQDRKPATTWVLDLAYPNERLVRFADRVWFVTVDVVHRLGGTPRGCIDSPTLPSI